MFSDKEPHSSKGTDVPQLLNQNDLNDLVRDLSLTKEKSELFFLRLKKSNALQKEVNCTYFRSRHVSFQDFFSAHKKVSYCSNTDVLFKALESEHHSNKWRLLIDLSKAV